MGRAQSQFIRIYDASSGSTYQRWQSYYGDATVSWDGAQWAYVPFTAEGFTEGISGDEANITISAPAIPLVVGAFNTAIRRGDLVDITMYEFDAELGNNAPQAQQQLIARYLGQVAGGGGDLTEITIQLGSAISPVGAQIPPRTFSTAIMGMGCRL